MLFLGGPGCHKDKEPGGGGNGTGPSGPVTAKSLSIPSTFTATAAGQTAQFTASVLFSDNTSQTQTTGVEWSSSDTSIATVSPTGLVTAAGGFGTATITAKYDTFTATRAVSVLLAVKSVKVTGNLGLTQVGQTSQLTATATLSDGTTKDITNLVVWKSNSTSVVTVSSAGLLTAVSLGTASVIASYTGGPPTPDPPGSLQLVIVTPEGTFIAQGQVKHPGHAGVAGFHVQDTQSGQSAVTNASGSYVLAGLTGSAHLAIDKTGFEPAELFLSAAAGTVVSGDVMVQPVIRITAGQSGQTTIAPHDVAYDVSATDRCVKCQLIRVVSAGPGTLHLKFTWNKPAVSLTTWIAGQAFPGASPGPLNIDVPVGAGEMVLYVGVSSGVIAEGDVVTLTITTTFSALDESERRSTARSPRAGPR